MLIIEKTNFLKPVHFYDTKHGILKILVVGFWYTHNETFIKNKNFEFLINYLDEKRSNEIPIRTFLGLNRSQINHKFLMLSEYDDTPLNYMFYIFHKFTSLQYPCMNP